MKNMLSIKKLFAISLSRSCSLSREIFMQIFCPFLISLFEFSLLSYKISVCILNMSQSFIRYVFSKYFLPICGWSFHFLKCHSKNGSFQMLKYTISVCFFCFFFSFVSSRYLCLIQTSSYKVFF